MGAHLRVRGSKARALSGGKEWQKLPKGAYVHWGGAETRGAQQLVRPGALAGGALRGAHPPEKIFST